MPNDHFEYPRKMVSKICSSIYSETKEPAPYPSKITSVDNRLLFVVDILLCHFILSPLVIANWAFAWQICDATGKTIESSLICCLIGFVVLTMLCQSQFFLKQHAVSPTGKALPVVASVYNIVVAFATILSWRGVWTIMDIRIGTDLKSCIASFSLGAALLSGAGALKTSAIAPPFLLQSDDVSRRDGAVFDFPTRFQQKRGFRLALDAIFTNIVSIVGVVGVWRALWIPQDILLEFDSDDSHALRSNLLSCSIGWLSALILIGLQPYMDTVFRGVEIRVSWWYRFAFESFWSLLQSLSTVFLWRGIWNLSETYLGDLFVGVPAVHGCVTVVLFTTLALDVLSMNCNTGAKGCSCDGSGIGNHIRYLSSEIDSSRCEIP
ncbi:uncharacterized protein LOC100906413 [Galendromus occidentalis]|uniref:Uncharacterized protein LOC100906413 n=1 Tax=Galendromus occidentalis TaxID=34638 RepID=A0AAJ7P9X0_9ACAR|nr:uncharacterized protein LOC100906413 [Galendromus occidentalis]